MGLALWNPKAQMASLLDHRKRTSLKQDLKFFRELVQKHEVEVFLIGLPYSLSGNETESTKNALFWVETLKREFSLPVYTQDESLSSVEAESILKVTHSSHRKQKRDSISAALFLEEFIRAQKS